MRINQWCIGEEVISVALAPGSGAEVTCLEPEELPVRLDTLLVSE